MYKHYKSRIRVFLALLALVCLSNIVAEAAPTKFYRSITSGNWNSTATWEFSSNNGVSWVAATATPTSADDAITIQNGHTVTVTASVSIDESTINSGGQVTINSGVVLTILNKSGGGTDLAVNGTLLNSGGLTINSGAAVIFGAGSLYTHAINGGVLPTATWNATSTCQITGITTTLPTVSSFGQSFGNFKWNCTSQTAALNLVENLTSIQSNLTITSTNTGSLSLSGQGNNFTMNIGGNLNVDGGITYTCINGNSTVNVTGNVTVTGGTLSFNQGGQTSYGNISTTMNINGNILVSGGTLDESACDANNNSKGIGVINLKGNLTASGSGAITESGNAKGQIYFNGTGTSAAPQYFISNNNLTNTIDYIVVTGTVLRLDSYILTGTGTFALQSAAGLMIGHSEGITLTSQMGNVQCSGTQITDVNLYVAGTVMRTYDIGADYTYNCTTTQNSGDGLPTQVRNLTINNPTSVTQNNTASGLVTSTSATLTFTQGIWVAQGCTLSVGISTTTIGSLSRITGHVYGYLQRWFTGSVTGDVLFPVGTMSYYYGANFNFSVATSAGRIKCTFLTPVPNATAGLPLTDPTDGTVCSNIGYGYWSFSTASGLNSGTFNLTLYCNGFPGITDATQLHVVYRTSSGSNWTFTGTHIASTGTPSAPVAYRNTMSTASTWYYGIVSPSVNSLPVELLSFTATPEEQQVKISWVTATEINNDYYTVERSKDGETYAEVTRVKGGGNSTEALSYSIMDEHPCPGVSYYRLKQTDYDGKTTVYHPVAVDVKRILIYPNPVASSLNFLLYSTDSHASLEIYDAAGKRVFSKEESLSKGQNTLNVDLSSLSKGLYTLRVQTEGGVSFDSFLK